MKRTISLLVLTLWGTAALSQNAVVTYHYDNARTGQNTHERILTPANVKAPDQFVRLFTHQVEGDVYAQPLYVPKLEIPRKGMHQILIQVGGKNMANPILVTGAAGRVGAVGRSITELLLKRGQAVRAMVRNEDERAQALREMGAEVVVGNLLDLDSMHRVIVGCEKMYFGMSISDTYLAATVNAAAVAKHHGVKAFINMSQMTVSQMSITETTPSPQHKLQWLSEQALNWSGLPVVHVRPTVFLEGFFLTLTPDSVRQSNQIRLPFGEGKTSPVAAEDVARVVAALLENPQPHIGKIYHLTGPQSENMHFYAQEYSKALDRTITYQDIPVEPWRDALLERGWPVHVVNHLTAMADLHRAGRFDRMSDDVRTLTGQGPLSVQEFVRKNAAAFTAAAKAKEA